VVTTNTYTIARLTFSDDAWFIINGRIWDTTTYVGNHYETFGIFVPEPMTMALLAVGGIGMMIRRRRSA
jgi:predicted small integral membrane protein